MNVVFKPTSIQFENNFANTSTAFLWFHSWEVNTGIVITKKDVDKIISLLKKTKEKIGTRENCFEIEGCD